MTSLLLSLCLSQFPPQPVSFEVVVRGEVLASVAVVATEHELLAVSTGVPVDAWLDLEDRVLVAVGDDTASPERPGAYAMSFSVPAGSDFPLKKEFKTMLARR